MNNQANAMPEVSRESQGVAPRISPARLMYWSMRREIWENPSVWLVPLIAAAAFLLGFLISVFNLRRRLGAARPLDAAPLHKLIEQPYTIAAALIMGTAVIVGFFYALDALYGERRDRSILFWKSLPVSDTTTVLAKITIPLFVLPVLSFAIAVVTQWIMLLLSSVVLLGTGLSFAALWTQSSFVHTSSLLLYHILTVHGLWYAPLYGWLLLASAWARRAPFLWAVLPPFAIWGVEKIAFNSSHFLNLLKSRLMGPDVPTTPGLTVINVMAAMTPARFFSEPGLWVGLAIAAAFLAAAMRLRRYREPI